MERPQSTAASPTDQRRVRIKPTDNYGLVLLLFLLAYVAVSTVDYTGWGRVIIVLLLGSTLWFTLRASEGRRIWQWLAVIYLVMSTLAALISVFAPRADVFSQFITIVGGLLLIITPVTILRHIASHPVITSETVLGAICVYLLIGFCFAFIYMATAFFSGIPFFQEQSTASANDYLFFSYSTLTTVGYGNLVPAGHLGQTFAVLEALFGQIYLVIIVARLVSLWGQQRPPSDFRRPIRRDSPGSAEVGGSTALPDASSGGLDDDAGRPGNSK